MPDIPRQHLETVSSPRASANALLLSDSVNQVRLGTGLISSPNMPGPAQLQYIPQPTELGQQMGEGMAQIADQVGKIALKIADTKAKNSAVLRTVDDTDELDTQLLGTKDKPGPLLLKGQQYLDSYTPTKAAIKNYINAKAAGIENSMERSYYLSAMNDSVKVINTQLRDKYKTEAQAVQDEVEARTDTVSVNNAIKLAYDIEDSGPVKGAVQAAIAKRAVTRGEMEGTATDAILLQFTDQLLAQPGGINKYNKYLKDGVYAGMSAEATTGIRKIIADNARFQNLIYELEKTEKEQKENIFLAENMRALTEKVGHNARTMTPQEFFHWGLEEVNNLHIIDPDGSLAKPLEDLLDRVTEKEPLSEDIVMAFNYGRENLVSVTKLAQMLKANDIKVTPEQLGEYASSINPAINTEVGKFVSRWKREAGGYMIDAAGLSGGNQYFIASPEAESFLAGLEYEVENSIREGFIMNGREGAAQAYNEAITEMKTSGAFDSNMQEVLYTTLNNLPRPISPLSALQRATADPKTGLTEKTTKLLADMDANTFRNILVVQHGMSAEQIDGFADAAMAANPSISPELAYFYAFAKKYIEIRQEQYPNNVAYAKRQDAAFDVIKAQLLLQVSSDQIQARPKPVKPAKTEPSE